jgi:hypothetical protein
MGRLRALLLLSFLTCALLPANGQTPLQINTPLDRTLGPSESHDFTVTLEENTWIQFVVEQHGIDAIVKVFSPEGRVLGEFDSPNGNDGPEDVSFVAAAAGVYHITVSPLDAAGTTSGRFQIKIIETRKATEQEIKASQSLQIAKAKGVALLLELEETITQLQSPFTRINAQLLAAQLLSEPEPKRASKYMTDAANGVKELIASIDASNPDYSQQYALISQLRFEMTRQLALRDPEAALGFLYSTVPPPNPYSNKREQTSQEALMEISIANQIAEKDPKRALQIARRNLKQGLSSHLMSVLSMLSQKNPELAADLANEMADKVLGEKLLKNQDAANAAVSLLLAGMRAERQASNDGQPKAVALLTDTHYRDLLQKAVTEALSYTPASSQVYNAERNGAGNLIRGLLRLGPEVETVTPNATAALNKKWQEIYPQQAAGSSQYQNAIANSPVDTALETIEKAPPDQREQLYLQLANREASNGDSARARQLIKLIPTPYQQRNALKNIDQQEIYRAMAKGKVDEALRLISGFPTPKERSTLLAQIASQIGPGQKRAAAINLLEQARAILGPSPQAQDQEHMNALFEIARAFARYDSKRAFEIVEPLIDQLNDICTAARTMEGFGAENFSYEELNLQNGGYVAQEVLRLSQALGTLAATNFERARAGADRLRLPEVRLRAYLDIAQQSISGPVR